MKETNFQKKVITGKRINLLISKEAYKTLQEQKTSKSMKITPYLESLILNTNSQNFTTSIALFDKLNTLINFNKKLFIDVNATFSNINQIAYRLNIANLGEKEEIEMLATDKEFQTETRQILIDAKDEVAALKVLIKKLISLIEDCKKQNNILNLNTKGSTNEHSNG